MNIDEYELSIFIVLEGKFTSHLRKLTEALRKEPNREFNIGDAFGVEAQKKKKKGYTIISHGYGLLVEIKCNDIEKNIGSLVKVGKRKNKR